MKKIIEVVAGIIENEKKEIFCVKRSESMSLPNFWEFPGGKVEKNESFLSALTVLGREFPHLCRWRDESPTFLFVIDIFS
ncbi:MAG: NUDIX domain-containing protein [Fusobacteriaceae bacterium]